jgi:hypothetical protein
LDFVMSKVGLSVCALMTVSVLGTVFGDIGTDDRRQELRSIVGRLCDVISAAALGYGDSFSTFYVPPLSSGEAVQVTITVDGTMMSSGGIAAIDHPCTRVHLWQWDGCALNWSTIEGLDIAHGEMTACSGATLEILGMTMMVDGAPHVLVFVANIQSERS